MDSLSRITAKIVSVFRQMMDVLTVDQEKTCLCGLTRLFGFGSRINVMIGPNGVCIIESGELVIMIVRMNLLIM